MCMCVCVCAGVCARVSYSSWIGTKGAAQTPKCGFESSTHGIQGVLTRSFSGASGVALCLHCKIPAVPAWPSSFSLKLFPWCPPVDAGFVDYSFFGLFCSLECSSNAITEMNDFLFSEI